MKNVTYKQTASCPADKRKGKMVTKWFRSGKLSSVTVTKWTKNYRP